MRRGEDNRGKCTDSPVGHHPIRTIHAPTSVVPPILCRMPFLSQPSQFILAWDRHQICWIAYLEAWLCYESQNVQLKRSLLVVAEHNTVYVLMLQENYTDLTIILLTEICEWS